MARISRFLRRQEFATDDDDLIDRQALRRALRRDRGTYRAREATEWLAELRDRDSIGTMVENLTSGDSSLRIRSVQALSTLRAAEAIPQLRERADTDPVPNVRSWSLSSLGVLGDAESTGRLVAALDDADWVVRMGAVYGLAALADRSTYAAVREAWRRERWSPRYLVMRANYRRALRALR